MKLTNAIQSATRSGATAACILALNSTASIAANSCTDSPPVQTRTSSSSIFDVEPIIAVAAKPQALFDRHLTVPETTAPMWLIQRMEALQQMPPPTLQEVDTQLKASAEIRKKLTDRQLA